MFRSFCESSPGNLAVTAVLYHVASGVWGELKFVKFALLLPVAVGFFCVGVVLFCFVTCRREVPNNRCPDEAKTDPTTHQTEVRSKISARSLKDSPPRACVYCVVLMMVVVRPLMFIASRSVDCVQRMHTAHAPPLTACRTAAL